jgi:hypothetical protein
MFKPLGKEFTRYLQRAEISQSALARQLNLLHPAQINKAANGTRSLPAHLIVPIVKILELSQEEAIRFSLLALGLSEKSMHVILNRPTRTRTPHL